MLAADFNFNTYTNSLTVRWKGMSPHTSISLPILLELANIHISILSPSVIYFIKSISFHSIFCLTKLISSVYCIDILDWLPGVASGKSYRKSKQRHLDSVPYCLLFLNVLRLKHGRFWCERKNVLNVTKILISPNLKYNVGTGANNHFRKMF